ncbi:MAG: RusA family crossover junction endodeoxyribonuclease [Phycisphaerales bacterium]|nr:RusA family crossover junction endodeoxyribonuclease [Phycisphaerales bacterium]
MEALNEQVFLLPFPPSVNHYWRMVSTRHGCRMLISREGRAYRETVVSALASAGARAQDGRLDVSIIAAPPDRRRRDLDNLLKCTLDSLAHGGAYHDDSQIDHLEIWRGGVVPGGQIAIRIRIISGAHP